MISIKKNIGIIFKSRPELKTEMDGIRDDEGIRYRKRWEEGASNEQDGLRETR